MIPSMLLLATASPSCTTPEATAAAAAVRRLPDASLADWGLGPLAPGLDRPTSFEIAWVAPCRVDIVRAAGGHTLVTADGTAFWTEDSRALSIRTDPLPRTAPEPPHPDLNHATFLSSASLMSGDWRVGVWHTGRTWLFARYRQGSAEPPVPLLRSGLPVLGLDYLGAPDAPGGRLSFVQRTGPSRYRIVSINWSEAGLRS